MSEDSETAIAPPPPYSLLSEPDDWDSNIILPNPHDLDNRVRSLSIDTPYSYVSTSPTTTTGPARLTNVDNDTRPARLTSVDNDTRPARSTSIDNDTPLYLYYRIYSPDGAIESKCAFQKGDPYVGRVVAIRISPPHTVKLVKRFLCLQEGILNADDADLFTTVTSESELSEQHRLPILTGDGPGSRSDEPMALIFKHVLQSSSAPQTIPASSSTPIQPSIPQFDPSRFSSTPSQLKRQTQAVNAIALSSDGAYVVSGSEDKTICIWDLKSRKLSTTPISTSSPVLSLALSPDGTQIISGQYDSPYIRLWDARTGSPIPRSFQGHTRSVTSVSYSPDGRRLASGSYDETIRIWDVQHGGSLISPIVGHTDYIRSIAFSPDGVLVVSGSDDGTVRVWDSRTGVCVRGPFEGHLNWVYDVAFSEDGMWIVSGSRDKTVRIWDAEVGTKKSKRSSAVVSRRCTGHKGGVGSVRFSGDGTYVLSGSLDGTVRMWDFESGETVKVLKTFQGHKASSEHGVWCVAVSKEGDCVVVGTRGGTVYVW